MLVVRPQRNFHSGKPDVSLVPWVDYATVIVRNPQNPILIITAPTLGSEGHRGIEKKRRGDGKASSSFCPDKEGESHGGEFVKH